MRPLKSGFVRPALLALAQIRICAPGLLAPAQIRICATDHLMRRAEGLRS